MGPTAQTRVAQIHPTRRCNLRCLHCYSSSSPEERGTLDATLLFPAVADLAAEGFQWISLSGGEPLLYEPLPALLGQARRHGLKTAVVTNGMLLTARRLDAIADFTDLLVISVDGKPESHNAMRGSPKAFDTMTSRLDGIQRRGLSFGFIFTLTQHNLDELPWVAEFAVNSGARLLQIHPLESFGNASKNLPGKVPDAMEGAYAWVLAQEIQQRVGKRIAIQTDLIYSEAIKQDPSLIYAGHLTPSETGALAELLSPLVVEPDGTVVPLQYGFSRDHALGNLSQAPLRELAERWRSQRWPAFQAVCQALFDQVAALETPRFFNWYEKVTRLADARAEQSRPTPRPSVAVSLSAAG